MKSKRATPRNGMRQEYDFDYSTAVRGKYYRRLMTEGTTSWFSSLTSRGSSGVQRL